ncbi:unnamed protein product [Calypogeia fissa]
MRIRVAYFAQETFTGKGPTAAQDSHQDWSQRRIASSASSVSQLKSVIANHYGFTKRCSTVPELLVRIQRWLNNFAIDKDRISPSARCCSNGLPRMGMALSLVDGSGKNFLFYNDSLE